MNRVFWVLFLLQFSFGQLPAHALQLAHLSTESRADANYCGDLNEIARFEIVEISETDLARPDSNEFVVNVANLIVLKKAIEQALGSDPNMLVMQKGEPARERLIRDLALDFDRSDRPVLLSCHTLDVLPEFGLEVSFATRQLVPAQPEINRNSYLTMQASKEPAETALSFNVVVNVVERLVLVYRIY